MTDAGCRPTPSTITAGPVTFRIVNQDSMKSSEAELVQGDRILGEKENLTPGLTGSFSLEVGAGAYEVYCPGAVTERSPFTVTAVASSVEPSGAGSSPSPAAELTAALRAATIGYAPYVRPLNGYIRHTGSAVFACPPGPGPSGWWGRSSSAERVRHCSQPTDRSTMLCGQRVGSVGVEEGDPMSLRELYATQIRVLWEWKGGPWALFKRLVLTLLVATFSFLATAWILPRITVDSFWAAAGAVILMALFNAIVRTVLLAFVAARSLILTGILVIVLQVVAFLIVAQWAPGVHVDGFVTALIGSFVFAFVNTALTSILGVDAGGSYYGLLIQTLLIKRGGPKTDKPGLVIVQIDGLAYPILAGRIRAGSVNTMAGWVRDRQPQAVALGGDPALDDLGQPGRHPPRQQRRDPGIPLVRARTAAPDGLEQPGRRRGDRPPRVERRGPSLEQRREHLQLDDRRRDPRLPDDRRHQGRVAGDRRQQGLPRVLLQPERLSSLVHAVPGRGDQGGVPGAQDPSIRESRRRCTAG